MSDSRAEIEQQIAELEADLRQPLSASSKRRLEAELAELREQLAALVVPPAAVQTPVRGTAHVSGEGSVRGAVVGVNQGTVQNFFGSSPPADAKELLTNYLETLVNDYGRLRLGKLLGKEQSGQEQTTMPAIALRKVYTSMATNGWRTLEAFSLQRDALIEQMDAQTPDTALPERLRVPVFDQPEDRSIRQRIGSAAADNEFWAERWQSARRELSALPETNTMRGRWTAPEDPIKAIAQSPRLVLLGNPGAGKSTLLRFLIVGLAEAILSGRDKPLPVPCFLQLGQVAPQLDNNPGNDLAALINALLTPVIGEAGLRAGLSDKLLSAWRAGGALICLDGLDEVSGVVAQTAQGLLSPRERLAEAIRRLASQLGRTPMVVTCRTRPYEQDAAWQLRDEWIVRRLQPFAFGQVRHFIPAWYTQTCASQQALYTPDEAKGRAARLIEALERRPQLRALTSTPLLLTMMALLDYNHKELPEKRADVYEELVKLLLDRWEGVRSSDKDRRQQSIGERLGLPHLTTDDLRPVLHELAFVAHQQGTDERGVVTGPMLREKLDGFFARRINPANPRAVPRERAVSCSATFEAVLREETGLLHEEADEVYALPHLTFEEYLASCYLAEQENVRTIYEQWGAANDRWREVVLLLMGVLLRQRKLTLAYAWLQMLLAERPGNLIKTAIQHQRDVLFAAACYDALGRQQYLADRGIDVLDFERRLAAALQEVLEQPDAALLLPQRIEAAEALATLGDARFPVTDTQWRAEPLPQTFGTPKGYWCYVPEGSYRIGGWDSSERETGGVRGLVQRLSGRNDGSVNLALSAFWIARFPITVAQYAPFVKEGYGADAKRWWTPNGWAWKQDRRQPYLWTDPAYTGANQPVIGVTWYEASAFCAWLSEQLAGSLPPDHIVRLPTEAEWEAAAAYDGHGQRRTYPWGEDEPTNERAIFEESGLGRSAPVGCCPAGAAACGALDLAGNVWEWTASSYRSYPEQSNQLTKDFTSGEYGVPLRGAAFYESSTNVRCGARFVDPPDSGLNFGFRVLVAPRFAQ